MPRISVVMPVYDGENYLRTSIDSVLRQSFKDFELIISDDCSIDNSSKIIDSFKDPRIKCIKQNSNLGIFKNLNILFKVASAPLIKIFCQDDIMGEKCLEVLSDKLSDFPEVRFAYSRSNFIDAKGELIDINYYKKHKFYADIPTVINSNEAYRYYVAFGCLPGNLSNIILRNEVLRTVCYFIEDKPYCADFEYWIRIAKKYPFLQVEEKLLYIRRHKGQASFLLNKRLELIKEEIPIYKSLINSGFDCCEKKDLESCFLRSRGFQYLDWSIKAALLLKFKIFLLGILSIRSMELSLIRLVIIYIFTFRGRFFRPNYLKIIRRG